MRLGTRLQNTADAIKEKLEGGNPKTAITLGSGLGDFAENLQDKVVIPSEIKNLYASSNG